MTATTSETTTKTDAALACKSLDPVLVSAIGRRLFGKEWLMPLSRLLGVDRVSISRWMMIDSRYATNTSPMAVGALAMALVLGEVERGRTGREAVVDVSRCNVLEVAEALRRALLWESGFGLDDRDASEVLAGCLARVADEPDYDGLTTLERVGADLSLLYGSVFDVEDDRETVPTVLNAMGWAGYQAEQARHALFKAIYEGLMDRGIEARCHLRDLV